MDTIPKTNQFTNPVIERSEVDNQVNSKKKIALIYKPRLLHGFISIQTQTMLHYLLYALRVQVI